MKRRARTNRPRALWLSVSLCLATTQGEATRARADAPPAAEPSVSSEPPGYRETTAEAVREFAAHHFEEARSLFGQAHALYPNARTHRGLGLAEFELRHYTECIEHFDAALRSEIKPLTPDLKVDTERMRARAYAFVARLIVETRPSAAQITLDGTAVATSAQPLLLRAGDHTLETRAPGFLADKRELSVAGGEEKRLTIILAPEAQAAVSLAASAEKSETREQTKTDKRWYKSAWLWTGLGIVVVGAAAGTGYALMHDEKKPYNGSTNLMLNAP